MKRQRNVELNLDIKRNGNKKMGIKEERKTR